MLNAKHKAFRSHDLVNGSWLFVISPLPCLSPLIRDALNTMVHIPGDLPFTNYGRGHVVYGALELGDINDKLETTLEGTCP